MIQIKIHVTITSKNGSEKGEKPTRDNEYIESTYIVEF